MQFDLKDKLAQLFTQQLSDTLAQQSGENPLAFSEALQGAIALSCYQFNHLIQQEKSARAIYYFSKVAASNKTGQHLSSIYKGSSHYQGLLNLSKLLFSDRFSACSHWLEQSFKIQHSTANAILQMTAPAVMSVFGEKMAGRRLSGTSITEFLKQQQPVIEEITQITINFPFYLLQNTSGISSSGSSESGRSSSRKSKSRPKNSILSFKMKWSFVLILSAGIVFYLLIKS